MTENILQENGKIALYEDLKRQILTLELAPGSDLDEAIFAAVYGVSRTPVREVFQRLAGEGYVEIRENRGARVAPMDMLALRHFFQVAPMIYAAIGRLAVQNFTPLQMEDLKDCQYHFRRAVQANDAISMVLDNNRFHEIMGEMSANAYLLPSLRRLLIDHARIGHTFYRPKTSDMHQRLLKAAEHHDDFIAALEARDEDRVVNLVFEHWALSRENMQVYITPPALAEDFLPIRAPFKKVDTGFSRKNKKRERFNTSIKIKNCSNEQL